MATYYIDPDWIGVENGTEAEPYSAWATPTLSGSNTYLQKAGTTATEIIELSELDGVTIGKYGIGVNPIVDAEETRNYCFSVHSCDDFIMNDFVVKNAIINNLYIWSDFAGGSASNIAITDVESDTTTMTASVDTAADGTGILIYAKSNVANREIDGVVLTRCTSHGAGFHGFDARNSSLNVDYVDCVAYNNGLLKGAHGFSLHPSISAKTSGFTAEGGGVYSIAEAANDVTVRVIDLAVDNLPLTHNPSAGAAPAAGEWNVVTDVLYVHLTGDATPEQNDGLYVVRKSHGPFTYTGCIAHSNKVFGGLEGHGFDADNASYGVTYEGCKSYMNQGDGFHTRRSGDVTHTGCLSTSNSAHGFSDDIGNETLSKYACTAVGNGGDGFHSSTGDSPIIKWSISDDNNRAFWASPDNVSQDIDYNYHYNNTTSELVNVSTGNNINTDSLISSNYTLPSESPCVGAATKWWTGANPVGADGEPFADFETDIGAIQGKWSSYHPTRLRRGWRVA